MKVSSAILLVFMLSGVLTGTSGEDCAPGVKKAMCHTLCMLNRLTKGECTIEDGKEKCRCTGKRSLSDVYEKARSETDDYDDCAPEDDCPVPEDSREYYELERSSPDDHEIARTRWPTGRKFPTRGPATRENDQDFSYMWDFN